MTRAETSNRWRYQALVLTGFIGFQVVDAITTHVGLGSSHPELNQVLGSVISSHGELLAYALKGIGVAVLLAILMLVRRRMPGVWHAYRLAGWISAVAVIANVYHLLG